MKPEKGEIWVEKSTSHCYQIIGITSRDYILRFFGSETKPNKVIEIDKFETEFEEGIYKIHKG